MTPTTICRLENEPLDAGSRHRARAFGQDQRANRHPRRLCRRSGGEFQTVTIDFYSRSDPMQPDPVLQSLNAVLQRTSSASMTKGVAAALLDNSDHRSPAAGSG